MSAASYKLAFMDVAMAKADDPAAGMLLARDLDRRGFKRGTDAALFRAFDDKFNPTASGGAAEGYSAQYAIEKARLVGVISDAGEVGWPDPYGSPKDKMSELSGYIAKEADAMDNFIKNRTKAGVPYEKAMVEYWDLPGVKALVAKKDVKGFVNRALTVGASGVPVSDLASQGSSILRSSGSLPAQLRMYNISDADVQLMGLYK